MLMLLGDHQSCLINFLSLIDSVSFIRRKAGMKDWCFLVFSEGVFTQWGGGMLGKVKNKEESESREDSKSILKLLLNLSSCKIFSELKFELK